MKRIIYYLLLFLGSFFEFSGDSSLKFYARTDKLYYGILGIISYISMTFVLVALLRVSNVMYTNVLWEGLGLILESGLAVLLLKEKLSNMYQYSGLFLVIVGMTLLNIGKIPY